MGFLRVFLSQKLVPVAASFWASLYTLFLALFGIFKVTILSVKSNYISRPNGSDRLELDSNSIAEEIETKQEAETKEPTIDAIEFKDGNESDDLVEKESPPKFTFKFQYQTYREDYEPVASDVAPSSSINKYDFLSGRDSNHYLEEPGAVNLTVKELRVDSEDGFIGTGGCADKGCLTGEDHSEPKRQNEENSAGIPFEEQLTERIEVDTSIKECPSSKEKAFDEVKGALGEQEVSKEKVQFPFEKDSVASDSDSTASSHGFTSRVGASTSDGFLTDKDFDDDFELEILRDILVEKVALSEEDLELEGLNLENLSTGYEADHFDEEDSDIIEELKQLEESSLCNSGNEVSENLPEKHFQDNNSSETEESKYGPNDSYKLNATSTSDSEDPNGLETLWEHQDFIEQLKMELKKARATGLPTILEEDESPKILEDLKPWKIDEKFQPEDRMCQLHKFYKSYRERMRKLDILNLQKMYAMGFVQSKDPLQPISSRKASAQTLTSLISEKLLLSKRKNSGYDPTMDFVRELHGDLEMVYVGQMCLSWEILHWQYEKSLELWDSDHLGLRRYNEVAGEFQLFQVLLQRFIEHEPFEGPRVENYARKRCIMRTLLQVPVIRDDSVKDKKGRRKWKDEDAITGDMLVEIIEESIRIFWRFVRADKDAHDVVQKGRKGTQIEPQDPTELELLAEVRTSLQKKEKKLKDILKGGNCILRKFRKHQEESSDQVLFFFSQVDMKLVSRVLNMSKITADQLLWCHHKLGKINFVSRKIHVEPSFLLFPC